MSQGQATHEAEVGKVAEELSGCYEELALLHGLTDRLRPFTDAERVARTVLEAVAEALRVQYAFMVIENPGQSDHAASVLRVEFTESGEQRFAHDKVSGWP